MPRCCSVSGTCCRRSDLTEANPTVGDLLPGPLGGARRDRRAPCWARRPPAWACRGCGTAPAAWRPPPWCTLVQQHRLRARVAGAALTHGGPRPMTIDTTPSHTRRSARAFGEAARRQVPREALGEWEAPTDRPDPVEILVEQGRKRVPELLPVRYGRMAVSPFTFLRGAPAIMGHDLSTSPTTPLRTQLCGDAHLSNFGVVRHPGAPADLRPERLRRDACPAPSSGTSSGCAPACWSPHGAPARARRAAARRRSRPHVPTASTCASSPTPTCWTSGTSTSS